MLTLLFIVFVVIPVLAAIGAVMTVTQNATARKDAANERDAYARARRLDLEERAAYRAQLAEQVTAQAHNKTALGDIKTEREQAALELARLKLIEQRNKMGLDAPDFAPTDYTSDPTPAQEIKPVEFTPTNYD